MSSTAKKYVSFGAVIVVIVLSLAYLAYTGVQESKSYYVTISELKKMGPEAHSKRLRVAGNVQPGSIKRRGTHVEFVLLENDQQLRVEYNGTEAPPDTFKDDSQALVSGKYDHDGVFRANGLQAKCASKYAPAPSQKDAQPAPVPAQRAAAAASGGQ
jgi:cytochrome c-type biogenesis protein CcmE